MCMGSNVEIQARSQKAMRGDKLNHSHKHCIRMEYRQLIAINYLSVTSVH